MESHDAIRTAKAYVADVFRDEKPVNMGLEELLYDDRDNIWRVTIGFSRDWQVPLVRRGFIAQVAPEPLDRTFKVIEIRDSDGTVIGMKNWPIAA